MRTRLSRSRHRALIPILIAGALALGATAAAGIQPSQPSGIPDDAFEPVTIDAPTVTSAPLGASGRGPVSAPIADPWLDDAPPSERARPSLPAARPIAVAKPTTSTRHSISGRASWYCDAGVSPCTSSYPDTASFDAYGAAGPRLRAAIGSDWRGTVVTVDGIRVKLIDWCQCYAGEHNEKLIDLYHDVFQRTGSAITIRW